MKKRPKKFPSRIVKPVVMVIVTLLAGGIDVRFEQPGTRFELQIGKSQ